MPRILLISGLCFLINALAGAQDTLHMEMGGNPVIAIVNNGDTIFTSDLPLEPAVISPAGKRKAETKDLRQYRRLIYNVKKVYPYAKLAGARYAEVIAHRDSLDRKRDQREYIKQVEDEILQKYEAELKELTITQGRILIKLIDRETRYTSYDVVKELRGGFEATFWQTIARLFGSNLKTRFDPEGEDKALNEIMIMIEKGEL
ncbi:MAG TPA: DUF4294 domain-containing protein [Bacteroidales bacterium]|nr:DUF4294 domain-containing protein [Bacteroidales bacterium]